MNKKKRVALICATPYHLYNAINMSRSIYKNECIDIFVINDFEFSYEYFEKIRKKAIFNNVYFIRRPIISNIWDKWKLRYAMISDRLDYFNKKNYVKYDIIVTGTLESFSIIFFLSQYKKNHKVEFVLSEDGMANYLNCKPLNFNSLIYRLRKINIETYINKIYLYKPILSLYNEIYDNLFTINQPDKETIKFAEEIFGVTDKVLNEVKINNIIYLDQPLEEMDWDTNRLVVIEKILQYLPSEKFVVKKHPRKQDFSYEFYNIKVLAEIKVPWEVIGSKVVNKTLVTFNSSAALTPNFIYDNNNKVIFLYKYFMKDNPLCLEWDRFFYKVREIYPEHIFIPETEEELVQVFDQVKEWGGVIDECNN